MRDEEGYFTVVDRVKDVINSGGVLVASRQVEDALYTHDAVAEVAVVGLPDERWIEAVTAVVVARTEVTEAELLAHAREKLAAFKAPKRVIFVDELPRNASGKILKRELRDRFADARAESAQGRAPWRRRPTTVAFDRHRSPRDGLGAGALLDLGFHGPLFPAPPRFERVRTSIAGQWVSGLRPSVAVAAAGCGACVSGPQPAGLCVSGPPASPPSAPTGSPPCRWASAGWCR